MTLQVIFTPYRKGHIILEYFNYFEGFARNKLGTVTSGVVQGDKEKRTIKKSAGSFMEIC